MSAKSVTSVPCLAKYALDGLFYRARIVREDSRRGTTTVIFYGFEDEGPMDVRTDDIVRGTRAKMPILSKKKAPVEDDDLDEGKAEDEEDDWEDHPSIVAATAREQKKKSSTENTRRKKKKGTASDDPDDGDLPGTIRVRRGKLTATKRRQILKAWQEREPETVAVGMTPRSERRRQLEAIFLRFKDEKGWLDVDDMATYIALRSTADERNQLLDRFYNLLDMATPAK